MSNLALDKPNNNYCIFTANCNIKEMELEENINIDKSIDLENNFDGVENEELEDIQPFDPEKISIDTKTITMEACLRRLEQSTIILNPDFQRNEVWNEEKNQD